MSAADTAAEGGGVLSNAAKGIGLGGVAGGIADIAEGSGLDKAQAAAGDVLRAIFGGLPWEMSASEIVDAVTPSFIENIGSGAAEGAGEAAGMLVPYVLDLVPVLV